MDRRQPTPEGAQNFKSRRHGERKPAPRFGKKVELPEVPEGMMLIKFHGEPKVISQAQPGEPMYRNSRFTVRQIDDLIGLEQKRLENNEKELTQGRDLYL